ncbi:hypothetical protein VIGAN_08190600 [Vigna angularis var. angularis]|uniref:Uncharacterized protein n=1 Tax=Vigna angularis var. angularis TaxID=157739 RepID=A0A0S3SQX2_PHAAN|nr:hypothetical protein VIGAN_08190600 [Vigna angularis var. angularis]
MVLEFGDQCSTIRRLSLSILIGWRIKLTHKKSSIWAPRFVQNRSFIRSQKIHTNHPIYIPLKSLCQLQQQCTIIGVGMHRRAKNRNTYTKKVRFWILIGGSQIRELSGRHFLFYKSGVGQFHY